MCWLLTGCALTARQRPKSACRLATSGACARTIGPRIRTNRLDDASARCSVSKRPDQPNDSCLFRPPSITRSTSNAISHPAARSASSETKRSGRGEPPPPPEPQLRLPIFTRPNLVRVTAPRRLTFIRHARELGFEIDTIRTLLALQISPASHARRRMRSPAPGWKKFNSALPA
jgi:hypothetical protein